MTKVFKVTTFIVSDELDDYEGAIESLETAFENRLDYLGMVKVEKIEESEAFEWDENLPINMQNASSDEYQKYIKEDKFACYDCGIDLTIEDERTKLKIKKSRIRKVDGTYLALCRECGEKDEV